MRYRNRIIAVLVIMGVLASGCGRTQDAADKNSVATAKITVPAQTEGTSGAEKTVNTENIGNTVEEPEVNVSGDLYAGYLESAPADFSKVVITCLEGTDGCYTMNGNTLTFTNVAADSIYTISGEFKGNIVIDIGDEYRFDLELHGLSFSSDSTSPVFVKSGDRVTITAKKGYQNYIYDLRAALEEGSSEKAAAIYSDVDLRIAGKGELTVVSENNNGIHSKKDLDVKNLTLTVQCADNALKGNDSVTLENATTTLIARVGDGIKTTKSDISGKGKQRGKISVMGGSHTIYAACDGLDAAYDVVIDDETTVINIFTDKYSDYSEEVTAVAEDVYYIRFNSDDWKYSVKYYNSEDDFIWVNPEYHSEVSGFRSSYYYYSFPKLQDYAKLQFFIYSADMEQGQETEYLAVTDYLSRNDEYDTFALTAQGNSLSYGWTNYTTKVSEESGKPGGFDGGRGPGGFGRPGGFGGPGGFGEGNTDKGEYSTKGIKAANEIIINNGTVTIKAYDDAIHADNDTALENGEAATGNVTVNAGVLSLYSNDDGLHADGAVTVKGGEVSISHSYEGVEGSTVDISGGKVSVIATDDGINASTTTGTAVTVSGGEIYILCSGDGIDSNSRTSYEGIVFSGGDTLVISNSGMNSAIDTEKGYRYEGGRVVAAMPTGGMSQEALQCENFSDCGSRENIGLILGRYATVSVGDESVLTFQIPSGLNAMVVYLGSSDATVSVETETTAETDANGVCWYK